MILDQFVAFLKAILTPKRLRELANASKLDEEVLLHSTMLVQWFEDTDTPVHSNMRRFKTELGEKLVLVAFFGRCGLLVPLQGCAYPM